MGEIDTLLENNAKYAAEFCNKGAPGRPSKKIAVVACMDARLDVAALLGVEAGDIHAIRNAGGAVTEDVIRSLTISQRLLGTREIMLIHHTDCGAQTVGEAELKEEIRQDTGFRPSFSMEAFDDVEESVRESMARIRANPFIVHKDEIRGFVYDVETGRLREVD